MFFNYYVCVDNTSKTEPYLSRAQKQKHFVKKLEGLGYKVVKKDLKILKCGDTKCDTDVEVVMDLHKHQNDMDNIVIFSGDSDFVSAVEEFHRQGKYIRIYAFKSGLSWELKTFAIKNPRCSYKLLDELKSEIERVRI